MLVNAATLDPRADYQSEGTLVSPWCVATLLAIVSALLVLAWPLGFTGDYLNHLARNYIEAQIWFDPALRQNYTLSFSVVPDLAMDMIVPWLSHVIGIYPAGAIMIWIALAAPPLAGLLVARSVHGRATWLSLLGFFGAFNQNAQWGFVNFLVATAIALAGFALWMRLAPSWRRSFVFAPFGIVLAFSHALGFLLFGYLVLLWEVACLAHGQRGSSTAFLRQLATRDAVAMLPGLAILALATPGGQALPYIGVMQYALTPKIASAWSGTMFFEPVLAKTVTISLISAFWIGTRRGILWIEPRMMWVCGGLLALIILMPVSAAGIWGLHFRYPAVLIILTAASIRLNPDFDSRTRTFITVGAITLLAAVFVNAAVQMAGIDRNAGMLRQLLATVEKGARVLPARDEDPNRLVTLHSNAMAVIERSAYVPGLFTNTSPVDVSVAMRPLHMPQSSPLTTGELKASASLELPESKNGFWSLRYYFGWPGHWDYIVYFRSSPRDSLRLDNLCPQAETENAVLYKITDRTCDIKENGAQG